jgi:hypothetical protein
MLKRLLMMGAAVLVACGSTPSGAADAGGGGGGGGDVGSGGGGDGGGTTKKGLKVSTLRLTLADKPTKEEPSGVIGRVVVNLDETPVKGATVKVNGVVAPDDATTEGFYVVSNAAKIPNAVPGGKLEITASSGGESTSFTLNCGGTDLVLKSPAEGTKVTAGQKVTVTWSGKTANASLGTITPVVRVVAYDAASNSADSKYSSLAFVAVKEEATSAELTLPDVQDAPYDKGYLLTLDVPGDIATDAKEQNGLCAVTKRVHLVK